MISKLKLKFLRKSTSSIDEKSKSKKNFSVSKKESKIFGVEIKACDFEVISNYLFTSLEFISENLIEGVMRKPGLESKQKELLNSLNHKFIFTREVIARQKIDVYTVACLLKRYLRVYPDGLLKEVYQKIIKDGAPFDELRIKKQLTNVLKTVEKSKMVFIYALFRVMNLITKTKETKMNVESVAIIFTPTLYTSQEKLQNFFKDNYKKGMSCMMLMITDFKEIFNKIINPKKIGNLRDLFKMCFEAGEGTEWEDIFSVVSIHGRISEPFGIQKKSKSFNGRRKSFSGRSKKKRRPNSTDFDVDLIKEGMMRDRAKKEKKKLTESEESVVMTLEKMGYPKKTAIKAARKSDGILQDALEVLFEIEEKENEERSKEEESKEVDNEGYDSVDNESDEEKENPEIWEECKDAHKRRSISRMKDCFRKFKNAGNQKGVTHCLKNIGEMYYELRDYEKAFKYYNLARVSPYIAENASKVKRVELDESMILYTLSMLCKKMNKPAEEREKFIKSIRNPQKFSETLRNNKNRAKLLKIRKKRSTSMIAKSPLIERVKFSQSKFASSFQEVSPSTPEIKKSGDFSPLPPLSKKFSSKKENDLSSIFDIPITDKNNESKKKKKLELPDNIKQFETTFNFKKDEHSSHKLTEEQVDEVDEEMEEFQLIAKEESQSLFSLIRQYDLINSICKKDPSPENLMVKANTVIVLAKKYEDSGDIDMCLKYYREHVSLNNQKNKVLIKSFLKIGKILKKRGKINAAIYTWTEMRKKCKDSDTGLEELGFAYFNIKNYIFAIKHLTKLVVMENKKKRSNKESLIKWMKKIGVCNYRLQKYEESLKFYTMAAKLSNPGEKKKIKKNYIEKIKKKIENS